MPIKKRLIDEALLSKSIPTLSDKQFVLAHSSLSQHEERSQRELFWYREELFKCVRGRWREVRIFKLSTKTLHLNQFQDWRYTIGSAVVQITKDNFTDAGGLPDGNCTHQLVLTFNS